MSRCEPRGEGLCFYYALYVKHHFNIDQESLAALGSVDIRGRQLPLFELAPTQKGPQ